MKLRDLFVGGAAIGAGITASLLMLPAANAELLYDDQLEAQSDPRIEDRGDLRESLGASHRAKTTVESQPMAPAPVQILHPENAQVQVTQASSYSSSSADSQEVRNMSKSELMRRERVREEVKNEDILQERLEELRLRDERRRTDQLLAGQNNSQSVVASNTAVTEQVIVAPVTERPGQEAAPVARQPVAYSDTVSTSQASVSVIDEDETRIWIQPRGGISQMRVNNYFEVLPHYSAGISGGVEVSENLSFELGYTFNEYGIKTAPVVPGYQQYFAESHAMKQNVFDGGLKLHFLGPKAKFRPFLSGGAAYSKSFVNYSDNILAQYRYSYQQHAMQDYESSSYLASLGTGFDVRVSKQISIGAMFKYYTVLSSRESQNLYYGHNPMGYSATAAYDPQKHLIGATLSLSSFYSILAGASFNF